MKGSQKDGTEEDKRSTERAREREREGERERGRERGREMSDHTVEGCNHSRPLALGGNT